VHYFVFVLIISSLQTIYNVALAN